MLICSSTYCKKCKQCGRYIFNLSDKYKSQINTVEPLADFGWGSIGTNSQGETHCEVHTYCGFNGNYAMFEPIESSAVSEGLSPSNKKMIDKKQIEEIVKETIYQNATLLVDGIDKQNNTHHYMLYDEDIFHIAKRVKEKLSENEEVK